MRYAITGASGWLGRATIATLLESGIDPIQIHCFSSKRKMIQVEDREFISYPIHELLDCDKIDTFVHLAFLTRDKVNNSDLSLYSRVNREITGLACDFIKTIKPRSVISISSGAVYDAPKFTRLADSLEFNPYGFLKIEEEKRLEQACVDSHANLVINRLWGLSGQDIQNTQPYALADFIHKAKMNKDIDIKSRNRVWRRYVDARELMALCLEVANRGDNAIFNSGGPLIEIGELAKLVVQSLGSTSKITRDIADVSDNPNTYYPQDQSYEELLWKYLKKSPLPLKYQILNTSLNLMV
jgi:nucleoside-diphosphate-sugar epimerase